MQILMLKMTLEEVDNFLTKFSKYYLEEFYTK